MWRMETLSTCCGYKGDERRYWSSKNKSRQAGCSKTHEGAYTLSWRPQGATEILMLKSIRIYTTEFTPLKFLC